MKAVFSTHFVCAYYTEDPLTKIYLDCWLKLVGCRTDSGHTDLNRK